MNSSLKVELARADLPALRPVHGEGGRCMRAYCPFHGGDRQRSLRIDNETGRFGCFACGVWGYLDKTSSGQRLRVLEQRRELPQAPPADRSALWNEYRSALTGARVYLEQRGISLELAERFGLGYAAPGRWAHPVRDWKHGRVVFPHSDSRGRIINLYGRAIGPNVPKEYRHDHLQGQKGFFCACIANEGPMYICEGPFDALSLVASGTASRAIAIFGLRGWRWEWARGVQELVLALDADEAGSNSWKEIARQGKLRGKLVSVMEDYGGYKDPNEAWTQRNSGMQRGSG